MKIAYVLGPLVASLAMLMSTLLFIDNQSGRLARAKDTTAADQRLCREIEELRRATGAALRFPPCAALPTLRPPPK